MEGLDLQNTPHPHPQADQLPSYMLYAVSFCVRWFENYFISETFKSPLGVSIVSVWSPPAYLWDPVPGHSLLYSLQPHYHYSHALYVPSSFLPQRLYTCCFFGLEISFHHFSTGQYIDPLFSESLFIYHISNEAFLISPAPCK